MCQMVDDVVMEKNICLTWSSSSKPKVGVESGSSSWIDAKLDDEGGSGNTGKSPKPCDPPALSSLDAFFLFWFDCGSNSLSSSQSLSLSCPGRLASWSCNSVSSSSGSLLMLLACARTGNSDVCVTSSILFSPGVIWCVELSASDARRQVKHFY